MKNYPLPPSLDDLCSSPPSGEAQLYCTLEAFRKINPTGPIPDNVHILDFPGPMRGTTRYAIISEDLESES